MTKLNAMEMRAVGGGATYYYKDICPYCGTTLTGKASGWAIFAPILKASAKKKFYDKLNSHIKKHTK